MGNVLAVLGTRPETIKMAPVIAALRATGIHVRVLYTGQHRELVDDVARVFGLEADVDLHVMHVAQSPSAVLAATNAGVVRELAQHPASLVIAQGDTASVAGAALGAFHAQVPFAHVEAGLRTGDLAAPFPEEGYRRVVSAITTLHFAPTEKSRANLLAEGVPADRIVVTGNTVVDALLATLAQSPASPIALPPGQKLVLATLHRRESFGAPLERVAGALVRLLRMRPDVTLALPVHPNPRVRLCLAALEGLPRAHLLPSLTYPAFVALLGEASVVITDSGGVQEEAPAVGVPVLVARETTERPEGVAAGCAELVGTDPDLLIARAIARLDGPRPRRVSPYGDGRASQRIAQSIATFLEGGASPDLAEVLPWAA